MPLKRARGLAVAQTDAIYFPMQDVKTEERVICKVRTHICTVGSGPVKDGQPVGRCLRISKIA
jgi:hypothetical protein